MTRVNLDMKLEDGNKVFTDVFVHGDDLYRLQRTHYIRGGDVKTETIDFTKEEYVNLFGELKF